MSGLGKNCENKLAFLSWGYLAWVTPAPFLTKQVQGGICQIQEGSPFPEGKLAFFLSQQTRGAARLFISLKMLSMYYTHTQFSIMVAWGGSGGEVDCKGARRKFLERWKCSVSWLRCLLHKWACLSSNWLVYLKCGDFLQRVKSGLKTIKTKATSIHLYWEPLVFTASFKFWDLCFLLHDRICWSHWAVILLAPPNQQLQSSAMCWSQQGCLDRELHLAKGHHKRLLGQLALHLEGNKIRSLPHTICTHTNTPDRLKMNGVNVIKKL